MKKPIEKELINFLIDAVNDIKKVRKKVKFNHEAQEDLISAEKNIYFFAVGLDARQREGC